MRIYSIFDDYDDLSIRTINMAGGHLTVHPHGLPRPDDLQMMAILEEYDCVIIGTSQRITEDMFKKITTPKVIATASVGIDHITVPIGKRELVTIINTPKANAQSVAEYTIGCALACCKRLVEGNSLYEQGKSNKLLHKRPEDLTGKIIGVIGAGNISEKIMEYALFFGMKVICWTRNPNHHIDLSNKGVIFTDLVTLVNTADVISMNLPYNTDTIKIISSELVERMKTDATFISVSRPETMDVDSLLNKAFENRCFYLCLDIDIREKIVEKLKHLSNVLITPHIAGGTIETRKRMFLELAEQIAQIIKKEHKADSCYL